MLRWDVNRLAVMAVRNSRFAEYTIRVDPVGRYPTRRQRRGVTLSKFSNKAHAIGLGLAVAVGVGLTVAVAVGVGAGIHVAISRSR
jgi:hypothetical protein